MNSKEIESIIPTGIKIILDSEYTLRSDAEVLASAKLFVKHRNLIDQIKKALKSNCSKEDLLTVVKLNFGVELPFDYKPEISDCDDAETGMLWWFSGDGPHARAILEGHDAHLYINDKKELKYIEPQTGKLFKTDKRLKITVMP